MDHSITSPPSGNFNKILDIMNIQYQTDVIIDESSHKNDHLGIADVIINSVKNSESVQNISYWSSAGKTASFCLRPLTWVKDLIKPAVKEYVARPICQLALNMTPQLVDGALYLVGNTSIHLYNCFNNLVLPFARSQPTQPKNISQRSFEEITRRRQQVTEDCKKWIQNGQNLRHAEETIQKNYAIGKHITYIDRLPENTLAIACKATAIAAAAGLVATASGFVDLSCVSYFIPRVLGGIGIAAVGAAAAKFYGMTSDKKDRIIQSLDIKTPAEQMTQNLNTSLREVVENRMNKLLVESHPLLPLAKGITQKYSVDQLMDRILLQGSTTVGKRLDQALQNSMLKTIDDLKPELKELVEALQESRLELIANGAFSLAQKIEHEKLVSELLATIAAIYATGRGTKLLLDGTAYIIGSEAFSIAGDPLEWAAKNIFIPPMGDEGLLAKLLYEGKKSALLISGGAAIKYTPVALSILNEATRLHSQGAKKIEKISQLKTQTNLLLNMLGLSRSSLATLIEGDQEISIDDMDNREIKTPEEKLACAISEAILGLDVTSESDPRVNAFLAKSFDLIFPVFVGFFGEVCQDFGNDIRFSNVRNSFSFVLECMRRSNEKSELTGKSSSLKVDSAGTSTEKLKAKALQLFCVAFKQFYFHLSQEISIQVKEELLRQKQGVKDCFVVWNKGVDDYYEAQGKGIEFLGFSRETASKAVAFLSAPNRAGRALIGTVSESISSYFYPTKPLEEKKDCLEVKIDKKEITLAENEVPENAEHAAMSMFLNVYENIEATDRISLEKDIELLFAADANVSEIFTELLIKHQSDAHYTKKLLTVMLKTKFAYESETINEVVSEKLKEDEFHNAFNMLLEKSVRLESHLERYHEIRETINQHVEGLNAWTSAANIVAPFCQSMLEQMMIDLISKECNAIRNKAGGDCLPYSFIGGTKAKIQVAELRRELAEYMSVNRAIYREIVREFLGTSPDEFNDEVFDQYLKLVVEGSVIIPETSSNYWGAPELQALCDFSERNIVLLGQRGNDTPYLAVYRPSYSQNKNPPLFLRYTDAAIEGARHYEAYLHQSQLQLENGLEQVEEDYSHEKEYIF